VVKVLWDEMAKRELRAAYNYIKKNSLQNAIKVTTEIRNYANEVAKHPETHSLDKYKLNNDGTFRYFEMHKLRVSYRVLNNGILITRVRHTKQKPRSY